MAKKIEPAASTTKTIVTTAVNSALPEYMRNKPVVGVDELREYMVIPRFRLIQKQSDSTAIEQYGMGTCIISPNGVTLCKKESSVIIVPLLFYPEWITCNDIKLKGKEPFILYSTRDVNDPLVEKCRDPKRRVEDDSRNPGMKLKHMEVLNFVCKVFDHEGYSDLAVLSFSGSGHTDGRRFNNLIRQRDGSIFAGRYVLSVIPKKNNFGDWFGFVVNNPTDNPWVTEEEYNAFAEAHEQVKKEFAAGRVKVVGENDDIEAPEHSDQM